MQSFDDCQFGDELAYVGPADLDGEYVSPDDWREPYEFRYVSVGGTLKLETTHNAPRYYTTDHPANNPDYWEVAQ